MSTRARLPRHSTLTPRRTRKRFSHVQLVMLENLFHKNSHPTRSERESLAKAGGMEVKSVTIWFQNKRQIERKLRPPNKTRYTNLSNKFHDVAHSSSSTFTSGKAGQDALSSSSQLSLDKIASRSELPVPVLGTPSRRFNPNTTLWERMPSSPPGPPSSPPAREYVELGKNWGRRTLEWACAATRLAEKEGMVQSRAEREILDLEDDIGEVLTRTCTWGGGDTKLTLEVGGRMTVFHKGIQDDDMMGAAMALCDLSACKP